MKNKVTLFVILVFSFSNLFSQSICVDFEILLNNKNDDKIYSGLITDLESKLENSSFNLIIDNDRSVFDLKNVNGNTFKDREIILMMADMIDHRCYFSIDSNFSLFEKSQYLIKNYTKTNWVIGNETKIIQGYECYKATCILEKYDENSFYTTYPIEAWFTYDIKKSFGPNGFSNLPGLILELKQAIVTFRASKVNICDNKVIQSNKEIISLSDYHKKEITNK